MRLASLLAARLIVSTSAFVKPQIRPHGQEDRPLVVSTRTLPTPKMGLSLSSAASIVTTGLYVAMGAVAGNGLIEKLPRLPAMTGAQMGDVAIDAILFCIAAVFLAKTAGIIGKINYASLEGLDDFLDGKVKTRSYANEAGERAISGQVASRSKDGRYEVATFAGGKCHTNCHTSPLVRCAP